MIKTGIVGATGYGGAELVRLLLGHPDVQLTAISSVSFEGMPFDEVYPSYAGLCSLPCLKQQDVVDQCDVVFAALPHGLSQDLAQDCHDKAKVFIDLGADFRLDSEEEYKTWYNGTFKNKELHEQAVYGLPELFRESIQNQKVIANPGCYPTAVALALAPAVREGLVEFSGIIADCKSGVTGAGRSPSATTHYPNLNESFSAYKIASHRHTPEMQQTLSHMANGEPVSLTFVPHLLPINRGILATCYARLRDGVSMEQVRKAYGEFYDGEFFVRLLPEGKCADVKNVRCSNFCDLSLFVDPRANSLIAVSAIDNMVKGAAGQAIQNMNLAFGLPETQGLILVPPAF